MATLIAASGLKYVGVETTALGWILCAALFALGGGWLVVKRPWQRPTASTDDLPAVPPELPGVEEPVLLRTDALEIEQA